MMIVANSQTGTETHRRREGRWAMVCRMQHFNPCRRPTWRWDWARDYAFLGRPLPKRGLDPLLAIAVQMHWALRDGRRPHGETRLAPLYLDLLAAHAVYLAEGAQRAELESRILARQSDAEIASLIGLSEQAVRLYADLFFDVRDRLHARDWIACFAIRRPETCGVNQADIFSAWRSVGYYGGPVALGVVIDAVREPADLTAGLATCDLQTAEGRLVALTRLAVAAEILAWSPELAGELVRFRNVVAAFECLERALPSSKGAGHVRSEAVTGSSEAPQTTWNPAGETSASGESERNRGFVGDEAPESSSEAA